MRKPSYFDSIQQKACERWNQLEADPELAGPWRLLFEQVQSPRHVLSELLQNADDAAATHASVVIRDGVFTFEHDGVDFVEEEFRSLCRFGFSNKRKLHTIGFRGVGFKSTFSLGESVFVTTPTLAVRFDAERFTEPRWVNESPPSVVTQVRVDVADESRLSEVAKNLQEWTSSPASLLFFTHLRELRINDEVLSRASLGPGPVPESEWIRLSDREETEVLVIRSDEEAFPKEAVDEIRRERNVEDLELPSCRVELVAGLQGDSRLYVVLPTGVTVDTPFSCNAPFLQDPARTAIKAPSRSPTNQWLLDRLGRLAAGSMLTWLGDRTASMEERAQAYRLLPGKPEGRSDSLTGDATAALVDGFTKVIRDKDTLLTNEGDLVEPGACICPPGVAYEIWTSEQLLKLYSDAGGRLFCGAVEGAHRRALESWDWIVNLNAEKLVNRLEHASRVPRPDDFGRLLSLWSLVRKQLGYQVKYHAKRLRLVPVDGSDRLWKSGSVALMAGRRESVDETSWTFLLSLLRIVDRRWFEYLNSLGDDDVPAGRARELRQALGFDRPSDVNSVAALASRALNHRDGVPLEDRVRFAHLLAALDAKSPDGLVLVTRDGGNRQLESDLVWTTDPTVEALLPEEWAERHLLHDAYSESGLDIGRWEEWVRSSKSGISQFVPLVETHTRVYGRRRLAESLAQRGGVPPEPYDYPYVTHDFVFYDFDFPESLVDAWTSAADDDDHVWARVLETILAGHASYWSDGLTATVSQVATTGTHKRLNIMPVPAAWIMRFQDLPCLTDGHGIAHKPRELHLRTPETEPLLGVEPFVRADLDREHTKELLRQLGVRDKPVDLDGLLERIRALALATDVSAILAELLRWYRALDAAVARGEEAAVRMMRQVFSLEALILTATGEFVTSSEVFQHPAEEIPDLPLIHPAACDLPLWERMGVEARPTSDVIVSWLKGLTSGVRPEEGSIRRVSRALSSYPSEIWEQCEHWLTLDGSWMPVESIKYKLTMQSAVRWSIFFPGVKTATADLRMLPVHISSSAPFSKLDEISATVDYRLVEHPQGETRHLERPWMRAFGAALSRVLLSDEPLQDTVRQAATRLSRSGWSAFAGGDGPKVTPYLRNEPAGESMSPDVVWHEHTVYARRDRGSAQMFDELVSELSRPFADRSVTEALKACIDRDVSFVDDYVATHFELDSAARPGLDEPFSGEPKADHRGRDPDLGGDVVPPLPGDEDGGAGESGKGDAARTAKPPRPKNVFDQAMKSFAAEQGYFWDEDCSAYVHPDGMYIERGEQPFRWVQCGADGDAEVRFWATKQSFRGDGVVIPAEVWEAFRRDPEGHSIFMVSSDGAVKAVSGAVLVSAVDDEQMELYPAKYRLRIPLRG